MSANADSDRPDDPAIVPLSPATVDPLMGLLDALDASGATPWFNPHPFTREYLQSLCDPERKDLYFVLTLGGQALGYGLLRGWDEGYEVPSLGIATHPARSGTGLGAALMEFLHCAARLRGSPRVRLRVKADNARAIALYRRLGYRFEGELQQAEDGAYLVGFKELAG